MKAKMRSRKSGVVGVGIGLSAALMLAACSGGGSGDGVEITFLVTNPTQDVALAEALAEAFNEENSDVTVSVDTRPQGGDGDNLVKTRLSTGEMADVFMYNSGSLFQALNPDQFLVDLSDQPWVEDLDEDFITTVSTENGIYGNAWGATFGGGIVYNRAVYDELGLEVPETWDEFIANNEAIAAEGLVPIAQSYGDTHTAQLFVLADFANVLAQDPDWADEYTANNRKYADEPAVQAFRNHQEVYEAGYFNENFPSATADDAMRMLAEGEAVHYPITTNVIAMVEQNNPEAVEDIGYFALPAQEAEHTQATIWQASALYIPRTTEGAELEAAQDFIAFLTSERGCELQNEHLSVAGPFPGTCDLPEDAAPILTDLEEYVNDGRSAPALEFLSPIKGPNLEHIMVEVGSGIRSAEDAAAYYDDDVVNQARQLGLDGW